MRMLALCVGNSPCKISPISFRSKYVAASCGESKVNSTTRCGVIE
jgi:hypothetical protein